MFMFELGASADEVMEFIVPKSKFPTPLPAYETDLPVSPLVYVVFAGAANPPPAVGADCESITFGAPLSLITVPCFDRLLPALVLKVPSEVLTVTVLVAIFKYYTIY